MLVGFPTSGGLPSKAQLPTPIRILVANTKDSFDKQMQQEVPVLELFAVGVKSSPKQQA